jgi:predicted Zn-dependent protease
MPPICSDRGTRDRRRACLLPIALLLVPLACASLTVDQERQLGKQLYQQARKEFPFMRDKEVVNYVRGIGEDILEASGRQPFEYHFYVIEDEDINAFAMPAGYIYVHTGTILRASNVSELAGVIAHEIGHVAHRHIAENYNRQKNTGMLYQLGVAAASMFGGGYAAGAAKLGGSLAAAAYLNKFGRDAERESDAFAVEVLPKAGYDPNGMVTFFETLQRQGGPNVPSFLSSHPATVERIQNTRAMIDAVPDRDGLRVTDRGRLQIIQRRIELLTGQYNPLSDTPL